MNNQDNVDFLVKIHELCLDLLMQMQGTEWDKAAFLEALRRVVADLVQ